MTNFEENNGNYDVGFPMTNFEENNGNYEDYFLTHLILCIKYHIYVCKLQNKKPYSTSSKVFIKGNRVGVFDC